MSETESSFVDELQKKYQQVHLLKEWELLASKQPDKSAVVLHSADHTVAPRVFYAEPHDFVAMARAILRELDPTLGKQILDALKRIESRLEESE